MTQLSTGRRAAVRFVVTLWTFILVVAACGIDAAAELPRSDVNPAEIQPTAVAETAATTTVDRAATAPTEAPSEFGVATHGAGAIDSLPGSDGMLGSGCAPRNDRLPDGIWFGWVVPDQASGLAFDLACLHPGQPPRVTNVNPQLRDLIVDQQALVLMNDGSSVSVPGWTIATDPVWVFVNNGVATEIAYPTVDVSLTTDSSEWTVADATPPVTGGCCGTNYLGKRSPTDPWPVIGMPADGVYDVSATADVGAGDVVLTIRRFVPCAEQPELCNSDYAEGDLGIDRDDAIVRRVAYDDSLRVRIMGVRPAPDSTIAAADGIDGSGLALRALIGEMQKAYATWIQPQLDYGQIADALMARGAEDSQFPYGSSDGYGAGAGPLAYRGPHGVLFVEWLSGSSLLDSTTTLEVSNGLPILYIDAGRIAG